MYRIKTVYRDFNNIERSTITSQIYTLEQAQNEQRHLSECSNIVYVNIIEA